MTPEDEDSHTEFRFGETKAIESSLTCSNFKSSQLVKLCFEPLLFQILKPELYFSVNKQQGEITSNSQVAFERDLENY
jgi:hypothetical protein